MDETPEGAEQVHRVKGKPGRKPKAVMASFTGGPVGNTYRLESINVFPSNQGFEPVADAISRSQSHAMRIWVGQSVDVPIAERVQRIVNGLKEQGMDLNITLPHPDAGRYLDAYK